MLTYFCLDPASDSKYNPVSQNDCTEPMLPREVKNEEVSAASNYPGFARSPIEGSVPKNSVLIKTGGNALQAVDRSELDRKNLVAVVVPENTQPGDTLLVLNPDGSGRTVSARIPEGYGAGRVFFVSFAPPVIATPVQSMDMSGSEPVYVVHAMDHQSPPQEVQEVQQQQQQQQQAEQDLVLVEEAATGAGTSNQLNMILVTVPEGSKAGDTISVQLPDQRIVVAIVPAGGLSHFFLQVPPSSEGAQERLRHDEAGTNLPPIV